MATQRVGGGREGTYVDVWQGPTQHCKAITFQLKIKKKKKHPSANAGDKVQFLVLEDLTWPGAKKPHATTTVPQSLCCTRKEKPPQQETQAPELDSSPSSG